MSPPRAGTEWSHRRASHTAGIVAIAQLLAVPRLLGGEALTSLGTERQQAEAMRRIQIFHDIWDAG